MTAGQSGGAWPLECWKMRAKNEIKVGLELVFFLLLKEWVPLKVGAGEVWVKAAVL